MSLPGPGYSVTVRLGISPDMATIMDARDVIDRYGALLTAIDVADSRTSRQAFDVSFNATDSEHVNRIIEALRLLQGIDVGNVSDRTFLLHLGGKLEVQPRVPLQHRDDLSRAYTPGVARVCQAIAERPEAARNLTTKRNTVAIVTDGTAVLGLGDLGPLASLPVMEGKAALFKHFGGVDAWPLCLDSKDPDEIVRTVEIVSPGFGGINLEDIAAPRCFAIETRLRASLDIPVFHDDQEGTAIVVLAALRNALSVVGKKIENVRIAINGVGAAGLAVAKLLSRQGAGEIIACDRKGALYEGRGPIDEYRSWIAENTNRDHRKGSIRDVIAGCDVFIGVSAADLLDEADVAKMASAAIVFALANPDPEIDATIARRHAAIVATGRSDQPNQINNVLAFPGFFRGLLDSGSSKVTDEMLVAAAHAISDAVEVDELSPDYIVPSVFNPAVAPAVAAAVRAVAGVGA